MDHSSLPLPSVDQISICKFLLRNLGDLRSILERFFFMLCATLLYYAMMEDHPFALTPSSPPLHCKFDVFPSFHGADVRRGFLSHLSKEFKIKEIDTFIDNKIGSKSIVSRFIKSTRGSKVAIVLLSRNYASSTWCLNELAEIMSCWKKLNQTVMVIFYDVDPSDVKKQSGSFGSIFRKTCAGKKREDIVRRRRALSKVATIAGYHSINWLRIQQHFPCLWSHLAYQTRFMTLLSLQSHCLILQKTSLNPGETQFT